MQKELIPPGAKESIKYSLFDALFDRRSRRFGLGMEIDKGELKYKSEIDPVPLSELEEALLVWAGTGLTGIHLSDLPPHLDLNTYIQFTSRTWPSPCANHRTELFYTNDEGTYLVKLFDMIPGRNQLSIFAGMSSEEKVEKVVELVRSARVKLHNNRADLPKTMPGIFHFNLWYTNKPGTTLFIPVTDMTFEYINLLFLCVGSSFQFNFIDEFNGRRPAGTASWVKKGLLKEERSIPIMAYEARFIGGILVEQAFICHNITLANQALGLGGLTFSGFLSPAILGAFPICRGLEFRIYSASKGHYTEPFPVGKDGLFEAFCPPYYKDMNEAVDAFLELKLSTWSRHPKPFKAEGADEWLRPPTADEIQMVKDVCNYIVDTYGRFPIMIEPMCCRVMCQSHHLDLNFYDHYYPSGAYTEMHEGHFDIWHPDMPNPFKK